MKTIIFLLLMCSVCKADVYVITNPSNNVYSVSDAPDAVVPRGYNLTVLNGQKVANLPISGNAQMYNFNRGTFTLNATAVQAQQAAQQQAIAQETAQNNARLSAIEKLTDAISKVDVNDVLTNSEMTALIGQ